ncbi:peroxidase family protein [Inquilinus sp. NPDC058860]|uniref:peroxidase family protein n=1 Tax=Inquilinus sp. NPDC058860 TaxID=3346652 RepID=UPI0036C60CB4
MGQHGGLDCPSFAARSGKGLGARALPGTTTQAGTAQAFRNFGSGDPPPAAEIHRRPEEPQAAQALIGKLIRRMQEPHRYADEGKAHADPSDNGRIPAGYTYFAQLAGHDIVHGAMTAVSLADGTQPRVNLRSRPLVLDTVYGRGPTDDPISYEMPEAHGEGREKLRLGHIRMTEPNRPNAACPVHTARDVPRARIEGLSDTANEGAADTLLTDPRNDDSVNLSQLTTLFLMFHNAVIDILRARNPFPDDVSTATEFLSFSRFSLARQITAAVYRGIVVKDLLPRLIRPEIWKLYNQARPRPLADTPDGRMPVEFCDAAYRLGHAMVRQSYRMSRQTETFGIRDVIETSSARRARETPIRDIWVVEWSRFFSIDGSRPQLSRRIGPGYNAVMLYDTLFRNAYVGNGDGALDPTMSGLLYRDLVRGSTCGLRTVNSLAELLPGAVLDQSRLLADRGHRTAALRAWLDAGDTVTFEPGERDALAADPPLMFYLLFEAAQEEDGKSFGTLASVIAADVFAGALEQSRDLIEEARDPIAGLTTAEAVAHVFGRHVPETMSQLIVFIAKALKLESVEPLFI